jgi:hypothetical protein
MSDEGLASATMFLVLASSVLYVTRSIALARRAAPA